MKVTTKLAYAVFPPYVWGVLRWESKLTWLRWSNALLPQRCRLINRFRGTNGLRIHLGCGARSVSGWVNVDSTNQKGVDLQLDLRSALPFDNCSAEMIYSEHVLEHFLKPDALKLLSECYRILTPGGLMRIGVPDAGRYLRAYVDGDGSFFKKL